MRNRTVAVSKHLSKARNKWSLKHKQAFIMCLTKIDWSKGNNSTEIILLKDEIIEAFGLKKMDRHEAVAYITTTFKEMFEKSTLEWPNTEPEGEETESWCWLQYIFTSIKTNSKGIIVVNFNPKAMPLFENLVESGYFTTFWSSDVYQFTKDSAFNLYQLLSSDCDKRLCNNKTLTVRKIKELALLDKESYMHNGTFQRSAFENKVLSAMLSEVNKSVSIHIYGWIDPKKPKGTHCYLLRWYEKIKVNGRVTGYRIKYGVEETKSLEYIEKKKERYRQNRKGKVVTIADFDYYPVDEKEIEVKELKTC